MSGAMIDKRLANALFGEAKISQEAIQAISELGEPLGAISGALGMGIRLGLESAQSTLDRLSRQYGGLWVGGRAVLTDSDLVFEPNALNRTMHENGAELRLDLPLTEIDAVRTRFGWITGIIDVATRGQVFSLRCYGSKAFAAKIETARLHVHS